MTDAEKVRLVQDIETAAFEQPGPVRDDRLLELVIDLVAADPGPALLVLWDRLPIEADVLVSRSLSFAMARNAELTGQFANPVLSSFLSSPAISDVSTLLNTIAAVELFDPEDIIQLAVLKSHLGSFLLRCLSTATFPVDAAISLLIRLVDLNVLASVLSLPEAADISEQLDAAVEALADESVSTDWRDLKTVISRGLPPTQAIDRVAVSRAIESLATAPGTGEWNALLSPAIQDGLGVLRDIILLDEFANEVTVAGASVVQQLHLSGRNVETGRVAIGPYARLITAWRRLFESSFGAISGARAPRPAFPSMFVVAPQPSSFVIRVVVDAGDRADLTNDAFTRAVKAVQARETRPPGPRDSDAVSGAVDALYSVLQASELDLSISMAIPRRPFIRARTHLTYRAARAIEASRRAPTLRLQPQQVVGTLESANHLTGEVDIGLEGPEPIHCQVSPARREDLLELVIGRRYRFSIEPRSDDDSPRWLLLAIEAIDEPVTQVEEPAAATSLPGEKLTSEFVPQQDRLDRIIQVVRLIAAGRPPSPPSMGMEDTPSSIRHIGYMKQAAKILNLISDSGTLTGTGRALVTVPKHRALELLALYFEASPVGAAWLKWARVKDLRELDPESAEAFLRERSVLPKTMIERRGRTLRKWVQAFQAMSEPTDE